MSIFDCPFCIAITFIYNFQYKWNYWIINCIPFRSTWVQPWILVGFVWSPIFSVLWIIWKKYCFFLFFWPLFCVFSIDWMSLITPLVSLIISNYYLMISLLWSYRNTIYVFRCLWLWICLKHQLWFSSEELINGLYPTYLTAKDSSQPTMIMLW
jgi:hypothetical protein